MKKIGKNKHIGIYIHHQDREHWLKTKELLPYFSCKLTIISSLNLAAQVNDRADFIKLPPVEESGYPRLKSDCENHKKRMNIIFNFIDRERPDLFYINESSEVAAFVNLLGVPYVYARMKSSRKEEYGKDLGRQLAYGLSLFNIASYENRHEEDWYKKTPYYDKTKYHLIEKAEINKKLFCMYLEDDFCLKKEDPLKPLWREKLGLVGF